MSVFSCATWSFMFYLFLYSQHQIKNLVDNTSLINVYRTNEWVLEEGKSIVPSEGNQRKPSKYMVEEGKRGCLRKDRYTLRDILENEQLFVSWKGWGKSGLGEWRTRGIYWWEICPERSARTYMQIKSAESESKNVNRLYITLNFVSIKKNNHLVC